MSIKIHTVIAIVLLSLVTVSCGPKKERWQTVETGNAPFEPITIHRYEKALFALDTAHMAMEINKLTDTFGVFLGNTPPDSTGIVQLYQYVTDPFIQELYHKTMEIFPDMDTQEEELNKAFSYYHHYFPDHQIPQIYSYVSGIDYQNKIILQPPALLIALDMYLGSDYEPYKQLGLPVYMIERFRKDNLVRDCMLEMANAHMKDLYPGDHVLEKMIFEGKKLYFLDAMLPFKTDAIKISYQDDQWKWCVENESNLWKFFIENQLLYSADIQVINKFFTDGPFTRGFPGSPSRLGSWLGWQIVRTYMSMHPEIDLQDLLFQTDVQKILKDSGYKPEKK